MKFRLFLSISMTLLCPALLYAQQSSEIFIDQIRDQKIRSVQLFPETGVRGQQLEASVIPLSQGNPLLLRFDLLETDYRVLNARIVHCNADWTQSGLSDIEFISEYNRFDLNDYAYSGNGKQLYVNYLFELPKVKISGNYVLVVFENGKTDEILFSKRFIVYENSTYVNSSLKVSTSPGLRRSHQQVDLMLNYGNIRSSNPRSEFKILIRQNRRWDNAIFDLQPTRVDYSNKRLEYTPFQGENAFPGGNEFRFVDLRTIVFRGRFVSSIDRSSTPIRAQVNMDETRQGRVYSELNDSNGGFFIETLDAGADELDADYVNVRFRLKAEPSLNPIYLIGGFNMWEKNQHSLMKFDAERGVYVKDVLLKQGLYDYHYWVDGDRPYQHDGSFVETNNQYEIFVYYRGFNDRSDRVVGYTSFVSEL